MSEPHELLVKYKHAKHKGIEAQVEDEIDRHLKYLDYILYKCGQSINKSYTINLKKAEKFLTRR